MIIASAAGHVPSSARVAPPEPAAAGDPPVDQVTVLEKAITIFFVLAPAIGVGVAAISVWGVGFDWFHLALLLGMFFVTSVGISVGYHRLFSHRSFKTYGIVQGMLAAMGAMAVTGTARNFVANHRRHHSHADRPGDPHSPHHYEDDDHGVWGTVKGFWHAHTGWFLSKTDHPNERRYAAEFFEPSAVRFVDQTNGLWVLLGLITPMAVAGLIGGSWTAAWLGLLWGGLVRIFLVHHLTWSINSVCHLWGNRPYHSGDHSRNNALFGILGMGEGWHNNHHAFPFSSRHGLRWWQLDGGYLFIRGLKLVGLAWDVRSPSKNQLEAAARRAANAR